MVYPHQRVSVALLVKHLNINKLDIGYYMITSFAFQKIAMTAKIPYTLTDAIHIQSRQVKQMVLKKKK